MIPPELLTETNVAIAIGSTIAVGLVTIFLFLRRDTKAVSSPGALYLCGGASNKLVTTPPILSTSSYSRTFY